MYVAGAYGCLHFLPNTLFPLPHLKFVSYNEHVTFTIRALEKNSWHCALTD